LVIRKELSLLVDSKASLELIRCYPFFSTQPLIGVERSRDLVRSTTLKVLPWKSAQHPRTLKVDTGRFVGWIGLKLLDKAFEGFNNPLHRECNANVYFFSFVLSMLNSVK
jgi:hypothetical protein